MKTTNNNRGLTSFFHNAHSGQVLLAHQADGFLIYVLGSVFLLHFITFNMEELSTLLTNCFLCVCLPPVRLKLLEVRNNFLYFALYLHSRWLINTFRLINCWENAQWVREEILSPSFSKNRAQKLLCVCRAPQLLSLCSRAREPQLLCPRATTTEARVSRAHAPQQEKPRQWEACALQWREAPSHHN